MSTNIQLFCFLIFFKTSSAVECYNVNINDMESNVKQVADKVVGSLLYHNEYANIAKSERIVSTAFGAFMLWKGVKDIFSTPSNAVWEIIIGGGLIYRGATGYCAIKDKLDAFDDSDKQEVMESEYIVEAL